MKKSHLIIFSVSSLQIDYLSIVILVTYPILLFVFFVVSQTFLLVFSHWLEDDVEPEHISRIEKIQNSKSWLNETKIKIINDSDPQAFSFTLFRIGWTYIRFEKVIILTTKLMDLINNDDELEAVVAHEYAHTKEHHSLFSNIFVFVSTLFFFIPLFRMTKKMIWQNSEIKADKHAIELIDNPLSLAKALYRIYLVDQDTRLSNTGATTFNAGDANIIINRIKIIISYSEKITIQM
jgi:Zn-dependent protease with chaperone function